MKEAPPMVELELLGANGDTIVMTDEDGERYSIVVDDALRAAVRRDRGAIVPPTGTTSEGPAPLRPRQLQAYMRAGATAAEVAISTGMDVEHVRRFEGPVLAERQWAVSQAQSCRIGWEKDSPLLGELVVDRLATRGVDPSSLEWDALREGRDPWLIMVTFVQSAEEKQARWSLDLTARAVHALDDEARWLTEAGAGSKRPAVFDQDSKAPGASATAPSAHSGHSPASAGSVSAASAPAAASGEPSGPAVEVPAGMLPVREYARPTGGAMSADDTDALLADLASSRGRRVEVELPREEDMGGFPGEGHGDEDAFTDPHGIDYTSSPDSPEVPSPPARGIEEHRAEARAESADEPLEQAAGLSAQVYSMSERRRLHTGNHPAGTRLVTASSAPSAAPSAPSPAAGRVPVGRQAPVGADSPTEPVPEIPMPSRSEVMAKASPGASSASGSGTQETLPDMPRTVPAKKKSRRRSRRSVPSWDEIVFGARPE
ncbi:DUF3071 domain-containing protein [Actinomyces viscosus]|nr:septation protein SepH [Actinomyces viscosus]TFH52975.1 DUF3071 domain-containing protein [Actinomyces viscosus]